VGLTPGKGGGKGVGERSPCQTRLERKRGRREGAGTDKEERGHGGFPLTPTHLTGEKKYFGGEGPRKRNGKERWCGKKGGGKGELTGG